MIVSTPPHNELPAYRPVKYRVLVTQPAATPAENAKVTIVQGFTTVAIARFKSYYNEPSVFVPGEIDYYFDIDIQKYTQDFIGPDSAPPSSLNNDIPATVQNNTDLYNDFLCLIQYEIINALGLIQQIAVFDVTPILIIYSASKKHTENKFLYSYIGNYPALAEGKYLTKSTGRTEVTKEDYSFLSLIQNTLRPLNINCFRVILLDSSFAAISFGYFEFGAALGPVQYSINSGFNQLQNYTYVQTPNFALPNIVYYQIDFGNLITLAGPVYIFTSYTEFSVYELKAGNCNRRALRLHWLNMLGGLDSYTFDSEKALSIQTSSNRSQKALAYEPGALEPDFVTDIGNFKTNSKASESYKLKSKFLTNEKAAFLSELLTSTKVYAEINGQFIPVIIEDTQQDTTTETGFIRYEITATLANDLIIQRI